MGTAGPSRPGARTDSGVLYLASRCAAGSPCTENYRLAVPARTAVVLNQTSGHVAVSVPKERDSEHNVT